MLVPGDTLEGPVGVSAEDTEEAGSTQLRLASAAEAQMRGRFIWCQKQAMWYVREPSGVFYPEELEEVSGIIADVVFTAKPEASSATVKAVKELVKVPLAVKASQFDSNPWLLATQSGVVDLETGDLLDEIPADTYLTKVTSCTYDPDAASPKWDEHLKSVFDNDDEVIEFFQKHMGASLIGDSLIKPQVFLSLQGASGGGKGVTVRALSHVLGDYACDFDSKDLSLGTERHSQWKTRFRGCRLAIINELPKGPIDTALIKALSGGDKQVAHSMRENDTEWIPTQTLLFTTNTSPRMEDTSGMRRRYLPLRTGPERQSVPGYEQALHAESEGIMAWLMEGLDWWLQEDGGGEIPVPDQVEAFRDAQIVGSDPMRTFVDSQLLIMDRADRETGYYRNTRVTRPALRRAYAAFDPQAVWWKPHDNRWGDLWDLLDERADQMRIGNERGWYGVAIETNN